MQILVSAGEVSGDRNLAPVIRAMTRARPELRFFGAGGDELRAAGVEVRHHVDALAVTGVSEALARGLAPLAALADLSRQILRRRPALGLLVDYPGVNMRLAALLARVGVPVLVYGAPQHWAWLPSRARALARRVDRLAVTLPFEERWFSRRGVAATFVGHPLVDRPAPLDRRGARARLGLRSDRGPPLCALLPGSRVNEVRRHLPALRGAIERLGREVDWALAVAPGAAGQLSRAALPGLPAADCATVLAAADVGLCASGTATLEAALAGVPTVVFYRLSGPSHLIARALVRVPTVALPNLVLGRRVLPELLQRQLTPRRLARELRLLLRAPIHRWTTAQLARLRPMLGPPGVARRVAQLGLQLLR